MDSVTIKELMKEAAHDYLYAHAMYCMYDCSDSMHLQDESENLFNKLNNKLPKKDRERSIVEFIKTNLPDEIQKAKDEALESGGEEEWDPCASQFLDEE